MKNNKIIFAGILIAVLILSVLFFVYQRINTVSETHEDFRSTPKTLTSIDAAKYLATEFIIDNSVKGIKFRLEEGKSAENWITFKVIPLNVDTDTATIYLSNDKGDWTVRGFGTVPPYEQKDYPKDFNN